MAEGALLYTCRKRLRCGENSRERNSKYFLFVADAQPAPEMQLTGQSTYLLHANMFRNVSFCEREIRKAA